MKSQDFTEQQDAIIRDLYENRNIRQWSMIATILEDEYGLIKNAKQCRDRYQKHLDPQMASQWTVEQEQQMYRLHDQIGNKWAIIAQKFAGKTDNCVKNHFYSKLRKSLRHLNKLIKKHYKKQFKEIKIGVIYKIIEALEERFKEAAVVNEEIVSKSFNLKYSLLEYADLPEDQIGRDLEKEYALIREIVNFGKNYKRKTKRERRNSNQGNELVKFSSYEKKMKASSDCDSQSSEYSQVFSHIDSQSEKSQGKPLVVIEEDIRESMNSKYSSYQPKCAQKNVQPKESEEMMLRGSGISIQSGNSVERILKDKGALQFYNPEPFSHPSYSHYSSNRSDSEKADMFGRIFDDIGDDLRFSGGLKQLMEIEQEQGPDQSLFRSQR